MGLPQSFLAEAEPPLGKQESFPSTFSQQGCGRFEQEQKEARQGKNTQLGGCPYKEQPLRAVFLLWHLASLQSDRSMSKESPCWSSWQGRGQLGGPGQSEGCGGGKFMEKQPGEQGGGRWGPFIHLLNSCWCGTPQSNDCSPAPAPGKWKV